MIKTKLIKTAKATILVIGGLPEGKDFSLYEEDNPFILYWDYENNGGKVHYESYELPPGKWQSVGFLDKIPEDVAKELVDTRYYDFNLGGYIDYTSKNGNCVFVKATEALRSLVAANCLLENQYGDYPKEDQARDEIQYYRLCEDWEAEEEKVFRNPYLLKNQNNLTKK